MVQNIKNTFDFSHGHTDFYRGTLLYLFSVSERQNYVMTTLYLMKTLYLLFFNHNLFLMLKDNNE